MSGKTTLAPCPFCGGRVASCDCGAICSHIVCEKCGAFDMNVHEDTLGEKVGGEAIKAWNTRADQAKPGECISGGKCYKGKYCQCVACKKYEDGGLVGMVDRLSYLLNGINPLVDPDYNLLNKNRQRLLHACLCAYAKHTLDSEDIGWDELSNTLTSAICETIGDDNFEQWLNSI